MEHEGTHASLPAPASENCIVAFHFITVECLIGVFGSRNGVFGSRNGVVHHLLTPHFLYLVRGMQ